MSYGYYEVKTLHLEHPTQKVKKKVRGHAFIWSVKLSRKNINWKRKLAINKTKYKLIRKTIPRIMIDNRKIWLGKKTITIYEPHSFYGETSAESRKYAVISLIEILQKIELQLNINLKPYVFKPSREHYGLIKNDLAIQCNRKKEKIFVKDDLEGEWLWIDDSHSLAELETGGSKAMTRNIQVQKWFNDHKSHNFKVTPTFVLDSINQVTQNQLMFNQNFESHVSAIQTLSSEVKRMSSEITRLNSIISSLKND